MVSGVGCIVDSGLQRGLRSVVYDYEVRKVIQTEGLSHGVSEAGAGSVGDMVKLLLEDRRRREEEYAAERARRDAEVERRTEEMAKQI